MKSLITYLLIYLATSFRYFLLSGLFFVAFYMIFSKKMSVAKIQQRIATKKSFIQEILHSLQANFILTFFGFLVLFTPLKSYTLIYVNYSDYPIWWLPVSFILALVIHDTYFYWMHRALHIKALFPKAHFVHHLSTNPSPWASYSFHLIEAATEALVILIIVFVIPIHPTIIMLFTLVSFLINIYGHLGYEIMPKWFRNSILFEIINTSVYHNLHHHKFKGNYGLYFRVWDRLMKTENTDYVNSYDIIQKRRFSSDLSQN